MKQHVVHVDTHHHPQLLLQDVFGSVACLQGEGQGVFSGLQAQHSEDHLPHLLG